MTRFFNQKLLAFCATAALATGLQAGSSDLDLAQVKASLGEIISSTPVQMPTTQFDVEINVNENGAMPSSQFTSQIFSVSAQGLSGSVHEKLLELNFSKRNPWDPTPTLMPPPAVPFHGGGLTPQYGAFISEQGNMMGVSSVVQGDFGSGNIWFDFPQTGGISFYQRVTDPAMPANEHFQALASLPMVHAVWSDGSAADFTLSLQAQYVSSAVMGPVYTPMAKPLFEFVRMPRSNGGAQPALPATVEGFFKGTDGTLKARVNQAGTISERLVQLV